MPSAATLRDAIQTPANPFPGLRPFEFEESDLFFGRDGQVEKMISTLARTRFLAVVGTSGSGKSSLVRAGLVPALASGMMPGAGSAWRIAISRPGNDPLGGLARALNQPNVFGSTDPECVDIQTNVTEATLRRGSRGLIETIGQMPMATNEKLLIVVDQFEELFRFARDAARETNERERYVNDSAAFVKLLLEARRETEAEIFVVLTMRSDFLGDCSQFWDLPEAINESQYLVPRLTRDQVREVITGPVALAGGEITNGVVNQLLNDLSDQDQLPVLQHLLMRIWDECKAKRLEVKQDDGTNVPHRELHRGQAIDLCCYEAVGTMAEALSLHADEAFRELPDERHRQLTERMFKRLTERCEDNREIRSPATFAELCQVVEPGGSSVETGSTELTLSKVIETFRQTGRSFLMPPAGLPLKPDSLIDISHESLIRGWKRLMHWVTEEGESAHIYRRLAETATLFHAGKAELARDRELQFGLEWREAFKPNTAWSHRYHSDFESAMDFLDKSEQAREAEVIAEEARRQIEIHRARRTALIFGLALIVALAALVIAGFQWRRANAARGAADAEAQTRRRIYYDAKVFLAQRYINVGQSTNARSLLETFLDPGLSQERGFEWYYLWGQTYKNKGVFNGHTAAIHSVAFSPDGTIFATGSGDNKIKLWDVATRKEVRTLSGHSAGVLSIAFGPDGRTLVSGSEDKTIKLWNVDTGNVKASLTANSTVLSVAISPDGRVFACGHEDGSVNLGDMTAPNELKKLSDAGEGIAALAFAPKGRTLAIASGDEIKLWDVDSAQELATLSGHEDTVNSLAFSADGKMLASAADDKRVKFWDMTTRQEIKPKTFDTGTDVYAVAFSPDGNTLATGQVDNCVKLWDLATNNEIAVLRDYADSVRSIAFSPDGKTLATGSDDYDPNAKLWDVSSSKRTATLRDQSPLVAVAFPPEGNTVATGSTNGDVKLWNLETHEAIATMTGHRGPVSSIAFSPDGKLLATGSLDTTVKLWNVATRTLAGTLSTNAAKVLSIAFSPDGKTLATAGDFGRLMLWDVSEQKVLLTLTGEQAPIWSVAFSPDGKTLATGSADNSVRLWSVATGKQEAMLQAHTAKVLSVMFSPDGAWLASGGDDRDIRLWDVTSGKLAATLTGHAAAVYSLAFSPDGKTLATGSYDKSLKLWDVLQRNEEVTLNGGDVGVISVAFSADGRTLAASNTNAVVIWPGASDGEVAASRK